MDVSFSGMQTKLQQIYNKSENKEMAKINLSFSLQETAFAMLVEAAERALAHTGKNELVLGGGVACNARLQKMCEIMCKERGAKFFCPAKEFLADNAGMIAYAGEIMLDSGIKVDADNVDIAPRERTDEVDVKWR
jgi:tRNA A37 threonylcarbamoyltransferase TsaD